MVGKAEAFLHQLKRTAPSEGLTSNKGFSNKSKSLIEISSGGNYPTTFPSDQQELYDSITY